MPAPSLPLSLPPSIDPILPISPALNVSLSCYFTHVRT